MKQIITAKLKLNTTSEQFKALRQTQLAYRDALNHVSCFAFDHGKTSNRDKLQKGNYRDVRAMFGLPSEMTANVIRQVGITYKGLWTKLRKNIEHRKAKITKKRFKGLDRPPKFVSPTVSYTYKYDYSFKPEQHVSIRTLQGRTVLPFEGYAPHIALIRQGATIRGGKLWFDKSRKQFYLLVCLEREVADPIPEMQREILGVDVGQRYLAVTATLTEKSQFFSGKTVRARADHYARMQKRLQRKGTRAAKRRLVALSGRERGLKLNSNHVIAKRIVDKYPHTLIGLEDLTGIGERTRHRRRIRKGKRILPVSQKVRRANRHASKWAFAELHNIIAYKAVLSNSVAVKVDADFTSQACPMCGYKDKENRPHKGLLFLCQNRECLYRQRAGRPYTLHADLVGARNIAMRTRCAWQDWTQTGQLSVAPGSLDDPDLSSGETKAARLVRYADLRWSSERNLC